MFSNYKVENWDHARFYQKTNFIFRKELSLIFYRLLIILKIINQIDIFVCSQKKFLLDSVIIIIKKFY